jgi:hypothetical protein
MLYEALSSEHTWPCQKSSIRGQYITYQTLVLKKGLPMDLLDEKGAISCELVGQTCHSSCLDS